MIRSYGVLSGYEKFIASLIRKYKLENNVVFLGPLDVNEMVHHQLQSDMCVVPSAVESYCLGLAEVLALGLPSVVSYSAAMPTIAKDKDEVLFYSPLDYVDCAAKIIQIFENKDLSLKLSINSRQRRLIDNSPKEVKRTQINIYQSLIGN